MSRPPLPRTAKGGRPRFHDEPAIDRLIHMVMTLTSEISVLTDRLSTVETLAGIPPEAIDDHTPDMAERAGREARREALLSRVLGSLEEELDSLKASESRDSYWDTIRRIENGQD